MKKLLGILVLGLLLVSCSEYIENKKIEKLEKCADIRFKIQWGFAAPDETASYKLRDEDYEAHFMECETLLNENPITFKEKYLK